MVRWSNDSNVRDAMAPTELDLAAISSNVIMYTANARRFLLRGGCMRNPGLDVVIETIRARQFSQWTGPRIYQTDGAAFVPLENPYHDETGRSLASTSCSLTL